MKSEPLFLVKFGKRDHLQEIVEGMLRFSPSQTYIELEEKQHKKGQGDLLEGKMKIRCTSLKAYDPDTNEFLGEINNEVMLTMSIQDVKNIPVFCLTSGDKSHCIEYISDNRYKIKFNDIQKNTVINDFPDSDSALIILEPNKFINDITRKYISVSDIIRYYDYEILTLEMLCLILGVNEIEPGKSYSLKYENKYRHLLCKDISFVNQNEYRFLLLDEYIDKPKKYAFEFTSKYKLVSLDDFFNGIAVAI